MDYIPKKMTITRKTGFSEQLAVMIRTLAEQRDINPRVLATELLERAVAQEFKVTNLPQEPGLRGLIEGTLALLERTPADDLLFKRLAG